MSKHAMQLHSFFRKHSFIASVAVIAGGTAMGQAVVLVASPILTRLYSPEDFGYLAAYTSLVSLSVVTASLRYQLAIPLPESDEDAFSLLALSLSAAVLVTTLLTVLLWGFGGTILRLFGASVLRRYIWVFPLGLLGAGAYQACTYWAIRKNDHKSLGITKLAQGIGLVVTQILLGLVSIGPLGLLLGDVVGRTAGTTNLIARSLAQRPRCKITLHSLRQNALRYRRFPMLSTGSAILNAAGLQLPALLLLALKGPQVAGWYALSQRLIGIPITLLGLSVSQVYAGKAARLAREAPSELPRLFLSTARSLFLLALAPAAALASFGPSIFGMLFGAEWSEAGKYTRILSPVFVLQFTVLPLSQTLNVLERQDLQLAWDITRLLLVLFSFGLTKMLQGPSAQAVAGLSAALSLAYLGLIGLTWMTVSRLRAVMHD